jgi:hypothetical protein
MEQETHQSGISTNRNQEIEPLVVQRRLGGILNRILSKGSVTKNLDFSRDYNKESKFEDASF